MLTKYFCIVPEARKVKVFYIGTIDGDKQRVRLFRSITEYEGNAYICLLKTSAVYANNCVIDYIFPCS